MRKEEFKKIMCSEIREIRLEHGDEQLELAKKSGVAASTISKYENCNGKICVTKIEQILSPYNISLPIFFKRILAKTQNDKLK